MTGILSSVKTVLKQLDLTGIEDQLSLFGDSETSASASDSDSDTDFEDVDSDHLDEDAPPAWKLPFQPTDNTFQDGPAFCLDFGVDGNSKPFPILKKFVTDEMVQNVCDESNRLVSQVKAVNPKSFPNWKNVNVSEMCRFIGINLAMGVVKKPSVKSYWSNNKILDTPFFGREMSRNRFQAILSSLHLHDKEAMPANCNDRYIKIGTFLKDLLSNLKQAVIPGEYLCLDESLLGYKGRLSFKQYNPMKRSRFGLLFYTLMDCRTGMVLDILPYQGKSTNLPKPLIDELGRGGATVMTMLEPHFNKNHKVVTDNFFNSPSLAKKLLDNGTFMLGTAQKRRKGMPKMGGKLKSGAIKTYCNGQLLLERWMDRREVVMMNTFMPHAMTFSASKNPQNSRKKPNTVLVYNKTMGAVDAMDKTIKPYATLRKCYKWYKKVYFHLIDVAVYNAYQVYKGHHDRSQPYLDFVLNIIETIFEECLCERSTRGRPTNTEKPETIPFHIPMKKGKSDCVWCKKELKKRTQTQITCTIYNVRLCLQTKDSSCFSKYHEKLAEPKQVKQTQRAPLREISNSLEFSGNFQPVVTSTPLMSLMSNPPVSMEVNNSPFSENLSESLFGADYYQ